MIKISKQFDEGMTARENGLGQINNPYDLENLGASEWLRGWKLQNFIMGTQERLNRMRERYASREKTNRQVQIDRNARSATEGS